MRRYLSIGGMGRRGINNPTPANRNRHCINPLTALVAPALTHKVDRHFGVLAGWVLGLGEVAWCVRYGRPCIDNRRIAPLTAACKLPPAMCAYHVRHMGLLALWAMCSGVYGAALTTTRSP
jgi:hypothetical protein